MYIDGMYVLNTEEYTEETTEETTEEVVEEVVEETVVDNSTGGNYHVIGNAFSDKGNADRYVDDMRSKGYGSAKILGKFDNLHMVSIQQPLTIAVAIVVPVQ